MLNYIIVGSDAYTQNNANKSSWEHPQCQQREHSRSMGKICGVNCWSWNGDVQLCIVMNLVQDEWRTSAAFIQHNHVYKVENGEAAMRTAAKNGSEYMNRVWQLKQNKREGLQKVSQLGSDYHFMNIKDAFYQLPSPWDFNALSHCCYTHLDCCYSSEIVLQIFQNWEEQKKKTQFIKGLGMTYST